MINYKSRIEQNHETPAAVDELRPTGLNQTHEQDLTIDEKCRACRKARVDERLTAGRARQCAESKAGAGSNFALLFAANRFMPKRSA